MKSNRESIISDENLHYLHMVFNKGEGLPEHLSNSNVYMTVIRGRLSIGLDDQEIHEYEAGTLLKIPFQTKNECQKCAWRNAGAGCRKAPAPKSWESEGGIRMKSTGVFPAGISMILRLAIPTAASHPARHLKIYPMIGSARFVLSARTNSNLLKTEF